MEKHEGGRVSRRALVFGGIAAAVGVGVSEIIAHVDPPPSSNETPSETDEPEETTVFYGGLRRAIP